MADTSRCAVTGCHRETRMWLRGEALFDAEPFGGASEEYPVCDPCWIALRTGLHRDPESVERYAKQGGEA